MDEVWPNVVEESSEGVAYPGIAAGAASSLDGERYIDTPDRHASHVMVFDRGRRA